VKGCWRDDRLRSGFGRQRSHPGSWQRALFVTTRNSNLRQFVLRLLIWRNLSWHTVIYYFSFRCSCCTLILWHILIIRRFIYPERNWRYANVRVLDTVKLSGYTDINLEIYTGCRLRLYPCNKLGAGSPRKRNSTGAETSQGSIIQKSYALPHAAIGLILNLGELRI
jgi:hypothetical protein